MLWFPKGFRKQMTEMKKQFYIELYILELGFFSSRLYVQLSISTLCWFLLMLVPNS